MMPKTSLYRFSSASHLHSRVRYLNWFSSKYLISLNEGESCCTCIFSELLLNVIKFSPSHLASEPRLHALPSPPYTSILPIFSISHDTGYQIRIVIFHLSIWSLRWKVGQNGEAQLPHASFLEFFSLEWESYIRLSQTNNTVCENSLRWWDLIY